MSVSYGPDFTVIPLFTHRCSPSRMPSLCPFCDDPVDVRLRHAVVTERWDGVVSAGRYAHISCCEAAS